MTAANKTVDKLADKAATTDEGQTEKKVAEKSIRVRVTHLGAPWPEGTQPGDEVIIRETDKVPPWALGKCHLLDAESKVRETNAAAQAADAAEAEAEAQQANPGLGGTANEETQPLPAANAERVSRVPQSRR